MHPSLSQNYFCSSNSQRFSAIAAHEDRPARRSPRAVNVGTSTGVARGYGSHGYALYSGIAVISVFGTLWKGADCFDGYVCPAALCAVLKMAASDPAVKKILLVIDSEGGPISSVAACAEALGNIAAVKPIYSYVEDSCCGSAYVIASRSSKIIVNNNTAFIGSIGLVKILTDTEKMMADLGIRIISIDTGAYKNLGMDGVKVTDEQIAYSKDLLRQMNTELVGQVSLGRDLSKSEILSMQGAVFTGREAVKRKLADVCDMTLDDAFSELAAR